jgi:tol-pal system protein YbgF
MFSGKVAAMPRRFLHYALVAFLVATAVTVPAGAANREHQQMVADIRMLQEQTQFLQQQIAAVGESLKAVSAKFDEQSGNSRKVVADQKLAADNMAADLRVIREKVDDNNVRISSMAQEVEALRLAIPPGAGQPVGAQPPDAAGAAGQPAAPPAAMQPGASPERMYEIAWSDYMAGQWTLAIQGFTSYLDMFPKSIRAGEAQYYIGKAYLTDGKFDQAVIAFNKVISDYPGNANVANSYYGRGEALEGLKQIPQARESYEYIVKMYPPDNPAVSLARQKLQRLDLIKRK